MGREINVDEAEQVLGRSLSFSDHNIININSGARELPLLALNHVSFVCKSIKKSVEFYQQVLGFVLVQRPSSFDFEGAWLFSHGIGIHLLGVENSNKIKGKINPKDNHISFQCSNVDVLIDRLEEMNIEYVKAVVREGGITVDQIFFHDPDGYMIEICNCQNLPVLPISSCPLKKMPSTKINPVTTTSSFYGNIQCSGDAEAKMMENLAMDMMNIFI